MKKTIRALALNSLLIEMAAQHLKSHRVAFIPGTVLNLTWKLNFYDQVQVLSAHISK